LRSATEGAFAGLREGEGQDKTTLLKSLDAEKAHAKKVAQIVFKNQPKILAQFGRAPKVRVVKRKAAPAATPARA
jgi:hypothetical protein